MMKSKKRTRTRPPKDVQIDEEVRRKKETMFKEMVNEAQENAETQSQFGFDPSEVDYDEDDEEVKGEEEEDVKVDDQDDDVDVQKEEEEAEKIPAWAMNLDVRSKKLPVKGLINNDVSEAAAQLYDNAVIVKILRACTGIITDRES